MLERFSSFSRARTLLPGTAPSGLSSAGAGEADVFLGPALGAVLKQIETDPRLEIVATHHVGARSGAFVPWPDHLDPRLVAALEATGRARAYAHQANALEAISSGKDVVLATSTSSGKSIAFQVPLLHAAMTEPSTRALLLFPTKALARDQVESLRALAGVVGAGASGSGPLGVATYDGDTPPDQRRAARLRAHAVATNPDMLHRGLLPNHERWSRFLAGLRFVVLDELHMYRGVFGSHVANVLRRLLRICAGYGARPCIVACSATIANPAQLARGLTGRDFVVVDRNAAPAGPRTYVAVNPGVVDALTGVRRDYLKVARTVTSHLRARQVPTLAFCRTRKAVELLTRYLREDEIRQSSGSRAAPPAARARADRLIRGYRGGYLPDHRREIERALRAGEAQVVASTCALELGMDIGGLDAVVLAGYPGSVAATLQRAGRAGRREDPSLVVMVLSSRPLDQFVANAPQFLFERAPEQARVDPDNPEILVPHLRCAAYERPLEAGEPFPGVDPAELAPVLQYLADQGRLFRDKAPGGTVRYLALGPAFPAGDVDLRGPIEENFAVVETRLGEVADGRILAEVDFEDGPLYLHPGAIYPLEGVTYEVRELDWEGRKAYVRRVDAAYYTEAVCKVRVRIVDPIAVHDDDPQDPASVAHGLGYAQVVRAVPGFKKLRFSTHENIGFGPVSLPDLELHTVAAHWTLPAIALQGLADPDRRAEAALAAAHALRHVAALVLMCDTHDLSQAVASDPHGKGGGGGWAPVLAGHGRVSEEARLAAGAVPCIYLYDRHPGGAGLASAAHEMGVSLVDRALSAVAGCRCRDGCPTCLGPAAAGDRAGRRADTALVLSALRDGLA